MSSPVGVRRVVLVVLDGLRPDAIETFALAHLQRLIAYGAATVQGSTVSPSVTAACMASLLTGVSPEHHGLQSARFHIPRRRGRIEPLPRVLANASLPTSAFMCRVPLLMRGIAQRMAWRLGIRRAHFVGRNASAVLTAAQPVIETQRDGLLLLHWPDADAAGHSHGWMTPAYADAAQRLDCALGVLMNQLDVLNDPSTLLIALADHGGGGAALRDHDSAHPLDRTIPIVLAGGRVVPRSLNSLVHLLDVPATIAWALGAPIPASYSGRPLQEAFAAVTPSLPIERMAATVGTHVTHNPKWDA